MTFFFTNPNTLAFVYTIVYHLYTLPLRLYDYSHDQHSAVPGKDARSPSGSSGEKRTLRCYATLHSNCEGDAFKSRSRLRRTRKTGGEREKGHTFGENDFFRRSWENVGFVKLEYTSDAAEDLRGFPSNIAQRIHKKMIWFAQQKNPLSFAKPLRDPQIGSHRFRVGDYRILVERHTQLPGVLTIVAVRHRSKAYE